MTEQVARPSPQSTHYVFQQLFQNGFTLSKLRDTVGQGQLLHSSDGAVGIPGRSMAWKLFLLRDEPLEPSSDQMPIISIKHLRSSRKQFSELLLEKMRAPDGSYDESFVIPGLAIPRQKTQLAVDLEMNNPLSLHDENPWRAWFAAVDLRKTIQQDVERTFPDMGYFRNEDIQHQLTNVLFLYCQMHPDIGYRQGMHELLAPLFYAVGESLLAALRPEGVSVALTFSNFDSVVESESLGLDPLFSELCSRSWAAADSWVLFSSLMRHISHWYEWQEPTSPLSSSGGPVNLKPYVPPVVQTCNHIQGTLLKSVDPLLHEAMQSAGVEPQMYGLRWLRLLFTREFPMNEAMMLWDGLFASSSPLPEIVQWTCVAMLIRIRTRLITSDYSTQLMQLLRYPPCTAPAEAAPHHILLLLRQATALEILHTPSAGASLAIENRNFLNIPIDVPEPPPVVKRRPRPIERIHHSSENLTVSSSTESFRQQPSFQLGFPELIARGLLDRSESLGINKTVMNAVSEFKRNLPDLTSTLSRPSSFGSSSYPLLDERTSTEKRSWNHHSESESARELAELRQQNKRLGEAVAWVLEKLNREGGQAQRKESLDSLSYVRDVLSGQIHEIDERRLWGEAEFKRRWELSPSVVTARPGSPRDRRRSTLHTAIPLSVNETLRGFISSNVVSGTPDHGRSASSGTPVVSRAPIRGSANNPFARVSSSGNLLTAKSRTTTGSSTDVQKQGGVEQDPLGVLG